MFRAYSLNVSDFVTYSYGGEVVRFASFYEMSFNKFHFFKFIYLYYSL